jgi:hypothetical protein
MVKKMNEVCEYANQPTILPPRWCCVACHFPHWVWVYGVERNDGNNDGIPDVKDSLSQPYTTVWYTYTHPSGQNLFDVATPNFWPAFDKNMLSVNLPWISGYAPVDDNGDGIPDWYRSSTRGVWDWVSYGPGNLQSPTAWTKYYDGSPNKNP